MGTLEVMDTGYCNTGIRGCGMWQRRMSESGLAKTGTSNTGSDHTEVAKTTRLDTQTLITVSQQIPRWLAKYKDDLKEQCCPFRLFDVSTKLGQSKCSSTHVSCLCYLK